MKRSFSRIMAIVAQVWTALAACVGCNGPQPDPQNPPPPGVSWTGEESGYRSTTPAARDEGRHADQQQGNP